MASRGVRHFWALASVVLISALLRPPLSAVGPLLTQIQAKYALNASQLGLLTSLPVLCFGVGAFAGPALVRRFGLGGTFNGLLVLLTALLATRVWFGYPYLLVASVLVGLAIAVLNVLFPTLIRVEFPDSIPRMTATYTTLLSMFAAIASTVSVPLAASFGGWSAALTVWAVPGALAIVAWAVTMRLDHPADHVAKPIGEPINLWPQPLTWALAAFFGLQSANFYVLLSWLPTMLVAKGMNPTDAGASLGYLSVIGIPIGLLITANLKRFKSLTWLIAAISAFTAAGVLILSLDKSLVLVGATLAGFGLASSFPLALALIAIKASNQVITTRLSAISQGAGYLVAAAAVYAARWAFEVTNDWNIALYGIAALACIQALAGIYSARHRPL